MTNKPGQTLAAVLALGLVAGILYLAYSVARSLVTSVFGLDEKVAAALIAACGTVIVSVATVVYTQHKAKSREIEEVHRSKKIEIYKQFMDKAIIGVLRASKDKSLESAEYQSELEGLFFSFSNELIVWGSPEVIRAYAAFRNGGSSPARLLQLDDLLRAIRQDLGNSNFNLKRGDLIKLFSTAFTHAATFPSAECSVPNSPKHQSAR